MGNKRKREDDGEEDASAKRKHRRGKRKKHKPKATEELEEEEGDEEVSVDVSESSPAYEARPLTLKIKLGSKCDSNEGPLVPDDNNSVASVAESGSAKGTSSVCVGEEEIGTGDSPLEVQSVQDDSAEEEEAWLEALESGVVDERGYLPQKKDSILTARQRAMLGTAEETELMELPSGKPTKEMTEEMLLKKSEKNRKRRLQALKRKEKDKAETVRKLIEKQSKKKDDDKPKQPTKPAIPHVRYINSTTAGTSLSLPIGMEYPVVLHQPRVVRVQKCAVEQCSNARRYSDTKTSLPLCSIECYRKLRSSTPPIGQHPGITTAP